MCFLFVVWDVHILYNRDLSSSLSHVNSVPFLFCSWKTHIHLQEERPIRSTISSCRLDEKTECSWNLLSNELNKKELVMLFITNVIITINYTFSCKITNHNILSKCKSFQKVNHLSNFFSVWMNRILQSKVSIEKQIIRIKCIPLSLKRL